MTFILLSQRPIQIHFHVHSRVTPITIATSLNIFQQPINFFMDPFISINFILSFIQHHISFIPSLHRHILEKSADFFHFHYDKLNTSPPTPTPISSDAWRSFGTRAIRLRRIRPARSSMCSGPATRFAHRAPLRAYASRSRLNHTQKSPRVQTPLKLGAPI